MFTYSITCQSRVQTVLYLRSEHVQSSSQFPHISLHLLPTEKSSHHHNEQHHHTILLSVLQQEVQSQ